MKVEWSTDPSEFANVSNKEPDVRLENVIDAVEDLPPDLKAVIDCIFWERLSNPAAIRVLEISPATFYRRLAEAKSRLAAVLEVDALGSLPAGAGGTARDTAPEVPVPPGH